MSGLSRRQLVQGAGVLGAGLLAGCGRLPWQSPPRKVYRIGYVRAETPPPADLEGFRHGLREHGYVEGENIVIEYRWADGDAERLRSLVAELIRLEVDLLVTSAPEATRAAKEATTTPLVVMALGPTPGALGLSPARPRPGGNTRVSPNRRRGSGGKRLDHL